MVKWLYEVLAILEDMKQVLTIIVTAYGRFSILFHQKTYLKCPDRVVLKMVKMMHNCLNDAIGKIVILCKEVGGYIIITTEC